MRVLPMGLESVLVEDPPGSPAAWAAGLAAMSVAGVVDVVPAAQTVLVRCRNPAVLRAVVDQFERVSPVPTGDADGITTTIDVVYDGDDLPAVAAAAGVRVDEVVDLHAGASYTVAFSGFAPGFGYLTGLPEILQLPRRQSPRTRVPAGSVAIAAEYSAVYPRASPGGWHLIGRTDHVLFDADRAAPATLVPGAAVRFRNVP